MSTHRSTARLCGLIGILLGQKSTRDQECIGRSRGGLSTKIHATCDALGNPTSFHLTPGQAHDLDGADALLPELLKKAQALLADKADGARERVLELLEQAQVQAVIPQKSNKKQSRAFDSDRYRWRHLIENFFAELKQYRAIATRYDKRACAFPGGVHLAAIAIWLK